MAPTRHQEKPVKLIHEIFRASRFVHHSLPLRMLNPASDGVFVHSSKNVIQTGTHIQFMEAVRPARFHVRLSAGHSRKRTNLDVSAFLRLALRLQPVQEFCKFLLVVYQGFTMISKGQRYETSACDPTADPTKNQAVAHQLASSRGS